MTVSCVAIRGYRSLFDVYFAPGPLTVITGGNGVGKSNVYKALELIWAAAHGRLAASIAREGGFDSAAWAGPENVRTAAAKRRGTPITSTVRKGPKRMSFGLALDAGCYSMSLGTAVDRPPFDRDPEVKEEAMWPRPPRRKNPPHLTREGPAARAMSTDGGWRTYAPLDAAESVLAQLDEPHLLPELHELRRTLRSFRFYHSFRTDAESPLRMPRIGFRTPVLSSTGEDLAAALFTILDVGDGPALTTAIEQGLGAQLQLDGGGGRYEVGLRVPGVLRRLGARELSDGSLKYLALLAALFSPRPAPLVVFNEPEASLHPDLLTPLAESIVLSTHRSSVWVVTHSRTLVEAIEARAAVTRIELERDEDGATIVKGQRPIDRPVWP